MEGTQRYTLSHTGSVLGDSLVTIEQNQVAPQRETSVIAFECPRKFDSIQYVGQRDSTRFVPRTVQVVNGTVNDDTQVDLNVNVQPVAGEEALDDQDYPAVVAYNVTQGAEVDVESVDYNADTVTLASDPADGTR